MGQMGVGTYMEWKVGDRMRACQCKDCVYFRTYETLTPTERLQVLKTIKMVHNYCFRDGIKILSKITGCELANGGKGGVHVR